MIAIGGAIGTGLFLGAGGRPSCCPCPVAGEWGEIVRPYLHYMRTPLSTLWTAAPTGVD